MREPISGLTHLAGTGLSVAVLAILVRRSAGGRNRRHLVAVAIFGASLVVLYGASTLYHLLPASPHGVARLRRLDHAMIYVLIAGTYTPFCLVALDGRWRRGLLGAVWGLAALGVGLKLRWMDAPVWLSTGAYVLLGWLVLPAVPALRRAVPARGMGWLVAGGLVYSLGALVQTFGSPLPAWGGWGTHEVWHLFVLAGSGCHAWAVARYLVLPP